MSMCIKIQKFIHNNFTLLGKLERLILWCTAMVYRTTDMKKSISSVVYYDDTLTIKILYPYIKITRTYKNKKQIVVGIRLNHESRTKSIKDLTRGDITIKFTTKELSGKNSIVSVEGIYALDEFIGKCNMTSGQLYRYFQMIKKYITITYT